MSGVDFLQILRGFLKRQQCLPVSARQDIEQCLLEMWPAVVRIGKSFLGRRDVDWYKAINEPRQSDLAVRPDCGATPPAPSQTLTLFLR